MCVVRLGDEAAFPMTERYAEGASVRPGLTKREYFAAMAMQGIASWEGRRPDPANDVLWAVDMADALLLALAQPQEPEAETRPGTQSGAV